MAPINLVTGLRRKMARNRLPRKKRNSLAYTCAEKLISKDALQAFETYMVGTRVSLCAYVALEADRTLEEQTFGDMKAELLKSAVVFYDRAKDMLQLDSDVMDVPVDVEENAGFIKERQYISLDSYANDDECEDKTRFTREEIRTIIRFLDFGSNEVRVHYVDFQYYKFHVEELVLYMLRKMCTSRSHKDLVDSEFGGCCRRWGCGYVWLVKYIDRKYANLIGPQALRLWAPKFPYYSEVIRRYLHSDKERINRRTGERYNLSLQINQYEEGDFNVFSVTDCTVYEFCRPGSGPGKPANGSSAPLRRAGWYIKQRAFYDGYHRGMEACCKILTTCLPNGLTAAVYGPTSGRQEDKQLFTLSQIDDEMMDICHNLHGGDLYCTYGDGIFGGYWYCLRTAHSSSPGMPLTEAQKEENENMKSVRETVEWSYAKAEQYWPMLNKKSNFKLEEDPLKCFAEIRVMFFLTNIKICCAGGSTCTTMFNCPPPTLEEYLGMLE